MPVRLRSSWSRTTPSTIRRTSGASRGSARATEGTRICGEASVVRLRRVDP
jgi:hypothetical protein